MPVLDQGPDPIILGCDRAPAPTPVCPQSLKKRPGLLSGPPLLPLLQADVASRRRRVLGRSLCRQASRILPGDDARALRSGLSCFMCGGAEGG